MSYFSKTCIFAALSVPTLAAMSQSATGPIAGLEAVLPTANGNVQASAPGTPATTSKGNLALNGNVAPGQGASINAAPTVGGIEKTVVENPDGSLTETIKYPPGTYASRAAGGNGQAGSIANAPMAGNSQPGPLGIGSVQGGGISSPGPAAVGSTPTGLVSVSPVAPDNQEDSSIGLPVVQCELEHRFAPIVYPVTYVDGYIVSDAHCGYRFPVYCAYLP